MEVLKVNFSDEKDVMNVVRIASEVLRNGGVVMHPTDTCYGLAVDVFNEEAVNKLYRIKGRDFNKPVSVMVEDVVKAKEFVVFNEEALRCALKGWPGALTLVLPIIRGKLPDFFNNGMDTVGVRVPDFGFVRSLLVEFNGVLTTTSANLSGMNEVYCVDDYFKQVKGRSDDVLPDLVIDGGVLDKVAPSTVVAFSYDGEMSVLRKGDFLCE